MSDCDCAPRQDFQESGQHGDRLQRGRGGPRDGRRVRPGGGGEGGGGAGDGAAVHPADCQAGGYRVDTDIRVAFKI